VQTPGTSRCKSVWVRSVSFSCVSLLSVRLHFVVIASNRRVDPKRRRGCFLPRRPRGSVPGNNWFRFAAFRLDTARGHRCPHSFARSLAIASHALRLCFERAGYGLSVLVSSFLLVCYFSVVICLRSCTHLPPSSADNLEQRRRY
jgi:hypothetical protein